MDIKRFLMLLLVLVFSNDAVTDDLSSKARDIEAVLATIKEEQGYPGVSLAISFEGDISTFQIGYADTAKEKSVNDETVFRVYSLTKGLTEILTRIVAESGDLDLNAPVIKYIPNLPPHMHKITGEQLLSHRGGIRHYRSNDEWLELSQNHCSSPRDAFAPFADDPLISEPGREEHYSSFGYVLLSGAIEAASEESFESLMRQHVFAPSGTERTYFDDPKNNSNENVTKFYEPSNGKYLEAPSIDNSCKFGGGAINSTPADIARVFNAYFSGKLTKRGSVQATSTLPNRIALSGEGLGGRSTLVAYPDENLTVVLVSNARGGNLQPYAIELAELLLDKK